MTDDRKRNSSRDLNGEYARRAPRGEYAKRVPRGEYAKRVPRGGHEGRMPRTSRQTSQRSAPRVASRASHREQTVRRSTPREVDLSASTSGLSRASCRPPHRKKRSPFAKVAVGVAALAVVALVAFVVVPGVANVFCSVTGAPSSSEGEEALSVQDNMAAPVTFTVTFAGDCTLGTDEAFSYSSSLNAMYENVEDPAYFMKNVYDIFSADDLTIVNMEGTLTEATTRQDKTFAFKGPAEFASILTAGDIEAASLANNHSKDYGEQSYTDTIAALDAAEITNFGYDRIAYVDVQGVKVALVGTYELALHEGIETEMVQNIQTARAEGAQVVLVYIHWGFEREYVPNATQMNLGHAAIDAGADLVVGSHPHVIQGYEVYKDRYIVYSLGNFCFGGNSNPSDKDCMIFQQTFTVTNGEAAADGQVNIIPCSISSTSSYNNYQPTPATGDEATRIMAKIEDSSERIAAAAAAMEA